MDNERLIKTNQLLMRKIGLLFLITFFINYGRAQSYVALYPSLTASPGTVPERLNLAFEYGYQWDVFSMGIDAGKTSLGPVVRRDTTAYVELRPNLNIFQQGRFTNTLTIGIGYIFNGKENTLMELTSGIEYAYSGKLHFNIYFGQYFYSGRYSASNVNFLGVSAMYYIKPTLTGSIFKKHANPD